MLYLGAKRSLLSTGKTLAQQVAALFASGEQGAWYEPSLTNSTLFQDSAGTTPVTAVGQPVGRMLDKSGRGNTATQPTAINRPVLQIDGNGKYYLAFNGTNSWMSTGSIDFTGTDKMTVVAGVRKLSDVTNIVAELSANITVNNGSFYLITPTQVSFASRGTSSSSTNSTFAAPITKVLSASMDISGPLISMRADGTVVATSLSSQGTGSYGNYPLYIGARGGTSLFFNGQLYGLIVRGALSTTPQIASAERFMNSKTGAY